MSLDLPKTSKEMQDWKWDNYKPYFDHLLNQDIDKENIETWMKDWSNLSELIGEVGTDVYVSTTVDTTDEGMDTDRANFKYGGMAFGKGGTYKTPKKAYGMRSGGFTRRGTSR